jgi:hypothetical protein
MQASVPNVPWPENLNPDRSSVFVHNELRASADCAAVWQLLVEAAGWPSWYPRCKDVEVDGGSRRLSPGASFRWSTNGQRLRSTVRAFEPGRELAWEAHNRLIRVYHRWSFEEGDGGCLIVTEEAQRGLLPSATSPFTRRLMLRAHQEWLERLDERTRRPAAP